MTTQSYSRLADFLYTKKECAMPPHDAEIAELKKSVADIRASIDELLQLKESIQELIDTWRAARGMLIIIKWLAGIASGLGVLWAALHNGSPH